MGIDTAPRQPFSIGSLHSADFTSVRTAADEGRTRLGLFERILDCVSDWVFNTDRAECKQCLLTFGSTTSTDLQKLQAFLKLESLAGANYKNRFTAELDSESSLTLSIEVDLHDFPSFSVALNRTQVIKDQVAAWAPQLSITDVNSLIEKLYSEQTTVDEKYEAYDLLRFNVDAESAKFFREELAFDDSTYLYAIDLGLDPFIEDFLAHGQILAPISAEPCNKFKENLIEIALAPMAAGPGGPEKQFRMDIDRGTYHINGVQFKGRNDDSLPNGTASVELFNQELRDKNFTEDEISMVTKFCHQSTMRAFFERAIDGVWIQMNQTGKLAVSFAANKKDGHFSIEINTQSYLPAGKSLSELATGVQRIIPVGTVLEPSSRDGAPKDAKGWSHINNDRKILYSDHTDVSIIMNFTDINKAPEVTIKSEMASYSGPIRSK